MSPWPLIALVWVTGLLALPGRAHGASTLQWRLQVQPGHVAVIELLRPTEGGGEERLARFLSADSGDRGRMGWRPDEEPAVGVVAGSIELALPPGVYEVRELDAQGSRRRALFVSASAQAPLGLPLPAGASGVLGWREGARGHDAFLWAPARAAAEGAVQATLAVSEGRWRLVPAGVGGWTPEDLEIRAGQPPQVPRFRQRGPPVPRQRPGQAWLVRLCLAPVTLLLLAAAGAGAWRARGTRGLPLALATSLVVAAVAMRAALPDLGGSLLDAGPPIEDPADSVGLLATITSALPTLSDSAALFAFPEGASWLHAGPSWLGYLPVAPISALAGPIAGHNLGVALGCALLCLMAWGLARGLGAGPTAALLAGVATALGPTALDELDAISLDRSTLYLVPLALLALHQAARHPGWRWPIAAGLAMAAVFYGQVYFGLYLVAAAPWLVLPRLLGPQPGRRLARLALAGAVTAALLAPGLFALQRGTADTRYATAQRPAERPADPGPWDSDRVADFLATHDPSLAAHQAHAAELPLHTDQERRMTATALGLSLPEALRPADLMPGRALYWPLALLSLVLARRDRRLLAAVAIADTAILMVHGMGPYLRPTPTTLGPPLPFLLDMVLIPGFEQLKNSHRFGLLAAAVGAAPLALGLDGLLSRLPRGLARVVGLPLALGLGLLLAGLRLPALEPSLTGTTATRTPGLDLRWPAVSPLPAATALDALDGPVLALPLEHPTPRSLVLAASARRLPLANPPSFDEAHSDLPLWVEDNALLNRLAWTAGSDRAGLWLELDPSTAAAEAQALHAAGLRFVTLHRELLPGPELLAETEALLDAHLRRVSDDGSVAAWALPAAGE